MPTLPSKPDLTGSVSEAQFKAALDTLIDYLGAQMGGTSGIIALTGSQAITSGAVASVPLVLKGAAGQTAALLDIQNSGGASLFKVDKDGKLYLPADGLFVGSTQLVVASSGSLGLGTAAPATALHIYRSAAVAVEMRLQNQSHNGGATLSVGGELQINGSGGLALQYQGNTKAKLDSLGAIDFLGTTVKGLAIDLVTAGNAVKHKNGITAPAVAAIAAYELFINENDQKLYTKNASGTIISLAGAPSAVTYLPTTGGTLTGDLTVEEASPSVLIRQATYSAGSAVKLYSASEGAGGLKNEVASAASSIADVLLDLDATHLAGGAKNGEIRIWRNTNLAGTRKVTFYRGDGTGTADGGIQVDPANSRVIHWGTWHFSDRLSALGTYQKPFLINGLRLWCKTDGTLLYKWGADPTAETDGSTFGGTYTPPEYLNASAVVTVTGNTTKTLTRAEVVAQSCLLCNAASGETVTLTCPQFTDLGNYAYALTVICVGAGNVLIQGDGNGTFVAPRGAYLAVKDGIATVIFNGTNGVRRVAGDVASSAH